MLSEGDPRKGLGGFSEERKFGEKVVGKNHFFFSWLAFFALSTLFRPSSGCRSTLVEPAMRPRLAPPVGRSHHAATPARVAVVTPAAASEGRPKGFGGGGRSGGGGKQSASAPTTPQQQSSTAASKPRPPQRADSPSAASNVTSSSRANKAEPNK